MLELYLFSVEFWLLYWRVVSAETAQESRLLRTILGWPSRLATVARLDDCWEISSTAFSDCKINDKQYFLPNSLRDGRSACLSKAVITIAIRLRQDYDTSYTKIPQPIRLRRKWSKLRLDRDTTIRGIARACFHSTRFDASKKLNVNFSS